MGNKKGNEDWRLRKKHGPNFKYNAQSLAEEFEKYKKEINATKWVKKEAIKSGDRAGEIIDIPVVTPMSIESFCLFADILRQTFLNYERGDDKDLVEVATHIRETIETQQFEGAVVGAFNPNIIARKLGLSEKTDITTGGDKINQAPLTPEQIKAMNQALDDKY